MQKPDFDREAQRRYNPASLELVLLWLDLLGPASLFSDTHLPTNSCALARDLFEPHSVFCALLVNFRAIQRLCHLSIDLISSTFVTKKKVLRRGVTNPKYCMALAGCIAQRIEAYVHSEVARTKFHDSRFMVVVGCDPAGPLPNPEQEHLPPNN